MLGGQGLRSHSAAGYCRGVPSVIAQRPHLVVVGLMGVGKTTVAEILARRLGRPLRDSDADITRLTGRAGSRIAADDGVDELHRLEEAVLLGALAAEEPLVVAAAGWVVESVWCREALERRAVVVWLRVERNELVRRMESGDHRRTLAPGELDALIARREPMFRAIADLVVAADQPPDAVADEILAEPQLPRSGVTNPP